MGLDIIIINGDKAEFSDLPGINLIPPTPSAVIKASGKTTIGGKKVCVDSDMPNVQLVCDYTTNTHTLQGTGILKIKAVKPDQLSQKTKIGNKSAILKGKTFKCVFQVKKPALNVSGPAPVADATSFYEGTGRFISSNTKVKSS